MRIPLLLLLVLLTGCSVPPLDISERLRLDSPETLILVATPPAELSLDWAPRPIEAFVISQNPDGSSGRSNYQEIAVGRLLSQRVEDYLGTVSRLVPQSAEHVGVTLTGARLNYKYRLGGLEYAKLLVNVDFSTDRIQRSKVYYRQVDGETGAAPRAMLDSLFDDIAIEIGQDILSQLAQ